jgi:hypothetical protein
MKVYHIMTIQSQLYTRANTTDGSALLRLTAKNHRQSFAEASCTDLLTDSEIESRLKHSNKMVNFSICAMLAQAQENLCAVDEMMEEKRK